MSKEFVRYKYDIVSQKTVPFKDTTEMIRRSPEWPDEGETKPKYADRDNGGKLEWDQVDFESLEPLVEVLMFGETKYSRDNWKKGQLITELLGSLFRHIIAFQKGEDLDSESGKSHIGHAMCNLMFIQYVLNNHKNFDNRKKGA